jgi:hypothetical protein
MLPCTIGYLTPIQSPNNAISRAAAPALGAVDIGTAEAAIAVTDNMLADEAYRRAAKAEENVAVERAAHRETAAELRMEQDRRMAAEKKLTEIEAQLEAFKERGSVTAERRITELEAQVGALRGQFEAQVGAVQGQFEAQARAFQEQRRAAERKVTELEDQVDALNEVRLSFFKFVFSLMQPTSDGSDPRHSGSAVRGAFKVRRCMGTDRGTLPRQ